MIRRLAILCSLLTCLPAAAFAGDGPVLEVIQGDIFVSTDFGFVRADAQMPVYTGQSIVLKGDATAIISDVESGCFISLRQAGNYKVPDLMGCHAGSAAVIPANVQITPTNGTYIPPAPVATGITPMIAVGSFLSVVVATGVYSALEKSPVSGP